MLDITIVTTQMLILFILIGCGYVCGKYQLLSHEDIPKLSKLVLNVGIPSTVLSSVSNGCELDTVTIFIYLAGFFMFNIFCAVIAMVTVTIFKIHADKRLYQFMYTFSNVGFMGLPVVNAVFGQEALIYAALFLLPNNLMLFSYGEYLMQDIKEISFKRLFNLPVIASLLAVLICAFDFQIPYIFAESLKYMGGITTPLAMIIIGASLNGISVKAILENRNLHIFLLVKMVVLPILFWETLHVLKVPEMLSSIMVLMMAMPIPSNTIIYASIHEKNTLLAAQASVSTNLTCVVSVPIVFLIISVLR